MGGYTFIAGVLLYLFLLQKLDTSAMHPMKMALIFAGGYLALQSAINSLLYYVSGVPILPNVFSVVAICTVVLQWVAASIIFYKAADSGDAFITYMLWGGIGLALVFLVAPIIAQQLVIVTML